MTKYLICACAVVSLLVWSCAKDTVVDDRRDYNGLDPNDASIQHDTVGLHPFLGDKYFILTAKEQRLLYYAAQDGYYSFKPIALPESDNVSKEIYPEEIQRVMLDCDNNNLFFGYPTAIEIDGIPLVVAEKRVSENTVNEYSDGIFLSPSSQGSKDWQLTEFFKYASFGNSFMSIRPMIAKTNNGKIVVKSNVGILVSDGDLESWAHYPMAFDDLNNNDKTYKYLGATMANSSKFGVFFGTGHVKMAGDTAKSAIFSVNPNNGEVTEVKSDWIPKLKKGSVFSDIPEINGPVFYSVDKNQDTDLADYDGYIVGFSVFKDKLYQFLYQYNEGDTWDDVEFSVSLTDIQGSLSRQSPVGIIYNPEVKRFEMMHSMPFELRLFSISVDSLLNNKLDVYGRSNWKQETSLLQRNATVRAQGMHPVSSFIGEENGKKVQRVYIDMGDEYPGRSGIFLLTRTLDTPALSKYVARKRRFIAGQLY